MAQEIEPLESFREGLAAGQEAGESRDLLYAAGFVAGFLWAVFASRARQAQRSFEHAGHTA